MWKEDNLQNNLPEWFIHLPWSFWWMERSAKFLWNEKWNLLNSRCFLIPCIKSRDYPDFLCKDNPAQPYQELMPCNTQPGGRKAQTTPTKPAQHHMAARVNLCGPENHLQWNWFLLKQAWQAGQANCLSVQNSLYPWIQLVLSKNATSQLLSTGQYEWTFPGCLSALHLHQVFLPLLRDFSLCKHSSPWQHNFGN